MIKGSLSQFNNYCTITLKRRAKSAQQGGSRQWWQGNWQGWQWLVRQASKWAHWKLGGQVGKKWQPGSKGESLLVQRIWEHEFKCAQASLQHVTNRDKQWTCRIHICCLVTHYWLPAVPNNLQMLAHWLHLSCSKTSHATYHWQHNHLVSWCRGYEPKYTLFQRVGEATEEGGDEQLCTMLLWILWSNWATMLLKVCYPNPLCGPHKVLIHLQLDVKMPSQIQHVTNLDSLAYLIQSPLNKSATVWLHHIQQNVWSTTSTIISLFVMIDELAQVRWH